MCNVRISEIVERTGYYSKDKITIWREKNLPYLRKIFAVCEMSFLWNILSISMKYLVYIYEISCLYLWNILFLRCPVSELFCPMKFPVYEMSSISMKCPVSGISCLWTVLSTVMTKKTRNNFLSSWS